MFAIKSMMTATLSADHRVADGAIGARFLREVKKRLETGIV
jgi:pyruvate dehydrogenase E2 component (dihydrolipoamide acetyltransferase)